MKNNFVHCELSTPMPAKAHAFYSKLFDWKIAEMPGGEGYLGVNTGSRTSGGGIQKTPMPNAPTAWMPYVAVSSVKQSLAKAQKLGARIVMPFTDIGMGAIGIFVDPTGASLGVYETAKKKRKTAR